MSHRHRKRVAPADHGTNVEIRPSRHLRIQHFNPRPRDVKFDKEMQMFLQYKRKGIPSSGPLVMPRRQASILQKTQSQSTALDHVHPHSIQDDSSELNKENNDKPVLDAKTALQPLQSTDKDDIPTNDAMFSGATSLTTSMFSTPTHQATGNNVRSASSVQLSLHAQKQLQNQHQELLKKMQSNIPNDIIETDNEDKDLHLELNEITAGKGETGIDTSRIKTSPSPLSPSTAETKANDASQHLGLYNKNGPQVCTQDHLNSEQASQLNPSNNVDTDLAIFFIHGVGGSSDIWCAQTKYFTDVGYEIVVPDLIGHGFSSTPQQPNAYHFKEIAADLEEMFDKYCKRKNVLIGHSYGASFATLLARNRSRRVVKLVLISGGPPTPLAPQPSVFNLPTCMLACIKPCLICGFYKGAFHKKSKPIIPKEESFNIPTYVLRYTMIGQDWPDGDEIFHNWLTCPTLLIYGAQDQLVSLSEEEDMAEAIYTSRLEVIQDASHMVMIETPDKVNQLIHAFLTQPSASVTSRNNNAGAPPIDTSNNAHPQPQRSKSRISQRSLKTAKSQRSLPHNLLSNSIRG